MSETSDWEDPEESRGATCVSSRHSPTAVVKVTSPCKSGHDISEEWNEYAQGYIATYIIVHKK